MNLDQESRAVLDNHELNKRRLTSTRAHEGTLITNTSKSPRSSLS